MKIYVLLLSIMALIIGNVSASADEMTFTDVKNFMEASLVEMHNSVDLAVLTLDGDQLTFAIHPTGDTKEAIRSAVRDAILTYQMAIGSFDKDPAHDILTRNIRIIITEKDGRRLGSTTCSSALIWRGQDVEPVTDTVMKSFEA